MNNHFEDGAAEVEEREAHGHAPNSPREMRDIETGSDHLLEQTPSFVHIDQEKLGQVLSSIVTHAAKCTPKELAIISLKIRHANTAELSESERQDLPSADPCNSGDHLIAGYVTVEIAICFAIPSENW